MVKSWLKLFSGKPTYPELEKAGGLGVALDVALIQTGSSWRVAEDERNGKLPLFYARVENEQKSSQVYIAVEEKLYLYDFWRDGVCLAHGSSADITQMAEAIDYWLSNDASTTELSLQFSFVKVNAKASAFDEGREVENTWNEMLQDDSLIQLREFLNLAINDPVLGKLFPFTSLYTLCFSRCSGYPFDTNGLPCITPKEVAHFALPGYKTRQLVNIEPYGEGQIFVVSKGIEEWLGEGNAGQAQKIIRNNMPENTPPARRGAFEK